VKIPVRKISSVSLIALIASIVAGTTGLLAAPQQQTPPAKQLTIEGIAEERERAKTEPQDPAWLPSGKALSFVQSLPKDSNSRPDVEATEIWSFDGVSGQRQRLVSAAELATALASKLADAHGDEDDDADAERNHFQGYSWAPDGKHLLLYTARALSWFDVETHTSRQLASDGREVANPEISPDGRTISFIREHSLWLVDILTGGARRFASAEDSSLLAGEPDWAYSHELGLHSAYWWSPDSSSIAWLETDDKAVDKYSLRSSNGDEKQIAYPKPAGAIPGIRVFVQAVSGGKPTQIHLGSRENVYIPRLVWLPDGKHLAIERLTRDQKTLDLLEADAKTGESTVILTENDVYWINLGDELRFLKDSHRFIWSSERSGFRHLYLYDVSGRQLAQLTQGDWRVASVAGVAEAEGAVYFTASEASPVEVQLYRVNLDGSKLNRITQQAGSHDGKLSPAGDMLLDSWSNWSTPPRLDVLHSDGRRIGTVNENPRGDLAAYKLIVPEVFTVKTHMGLGMNAWMMRPPGFDPARKYPVIVYVAGGPAEQAVLNAWGGDIYLWFSLMTQKGYIVFAVDNRGASEGGHVFEEPLHLRFSSVEMADQRDGVLFLRSLPYIDKARIGICGWGFGGFLALHGMLDRPLLFGAGFAGSPITDWHLYDAVFTERYLEDPTRNQDGWLASSPIENAQYLRSPLMVAQATLDERVHLENTLLLLDRLLDKGKYADTLLFPDRRDMFQDRGARLILFQKMTDFFLKNL